jgi:tetratricopeptide (TPR) repeat protein
LLGTILTNSAEICQTMGDLQGALTRYSAAIDVLAEAGDRYTEGMASAGLGETLRLLGRLDESLRQHRQALAILDDLGTGHREQVATLERLAATLTDMGRAEEASRHLARADELRSLANGE